MMLRFKKEIQNIHTIVTLELTILSVPTTFIVSYILEPLSIEMLYQSQIALFYKIMYED